WLQSPAGTGFTISDLICDVKLKCKAKAPARLMRGRGSDGFDVALLHGGLPRLGFFTLVGRNGEDAILELGVALALVDGRREREAPLEARVAALMQQELALVPVTFLVLFLALGGDGQRLVLQGDVDIILLETRQLGFDIEMIGILPDI